MNPLKKSVKERTRIFSNGVIFPEDIDYAIANRYLPPFELLNFRIKITGEVIFTFEDKKPEGSNIFHVKRGFIENRQWDEN
jgi:hypothetical protein